MTTPTTPPHRRPRHLLTTPPQLATCPTCQRTTLTGTDTGIPYQTDAIPLTLHGELHARLTNRNTYRLAAGHIFHRTIDDIKHSHSNRNPIVAAHTCQPINTHHISVSHIPTLTALINDLQPTTPNQKTNQGTLLDPNGQPITETFDNQNPPF